MPRTDTTPTIPSDQDALLAREASRAITTHFLARSVVVTPETLDIEFRKFGAGTNVEIIPSFEGAPAR